MGEPKEKVRARMVEQLVKGGFEAKKEEEGEGDAMDRS